MANNDKDSLRGKLPGGLVFSANGKSAYQLAVENGYEGSVEQWLESLQGPPGTPDPKQITADVNAFLEKNPPAAGRDGGYYLPTVTQPNDNTLQLEFSRSKEDMPAVEPARVTLPPVSVQSVNGKTGAVQLSAADVKARPDTWTPTAQEVGALPSTYIPPDQTAAQVGADPAGTAASSVSQHNTNNDSHNDIRLALKAINDRLNAFFDVDDQTLDELSEIVAFIVTNKSLIDAITTSKVSVADIVDNLTTNVANRPLSAAQGVVLKGLIDTVSNSLSNYQPKGDYALRSELPTVPTKVSAFTNDAGYLTQHQDISGLLPKTELPAAIEDALTQAKESGEFTGPQGPAYKLTEEDKAAITAMVIESLGGNSVFGYVDENNNIIVSGNLADGTYSVCYEMEDGSTVDIGDLVLDSNVYYSVTNHLENCVNSNSAAEAIGGESYSAVISANSGYELTSVVVTMGGSPVSVSGGNISIAEVTGDIVITAVATEVQKEPTNFADPTSSDWKVGYRLTDNITQVKALTGGVATNYIAVQVGDIVTVEGINFTDTNNRIAHDGVNEAIGQASVYATTYSTQGIFENVTYDSNRITLTVKFDTISNMRFSGLATGASEDVIVKITRNGVLL